MIWLPIAALSALAMWLAWPELDESTLAAAVWMVAVIPLAIALANLAGPIL